ncbi:MAG: IS630 family transposase [Gallionella sp.]|nr:IS630 family transposase [Gallionella sp.]
MKNRPDARKLDIATQTHLRRTVVRAVRGGMSQTEASKVYGASLRAVSKWMALERSGGLRALKQKRRGRRAGEGHLQPAQSARIRQLIIDSLPDQLKLPFYLWTRAAVVSLIEREYGVSVSLTTVGRYLAGWGMSPQKPVRRAYERNDAAIAHWLRTEYPAIARDAKREKAVIYWGDEMGLRSDHVAGTSYAPMGQTPIIRATGQRFGCNMISAITNRGHLAFMVFQGKFDGRLFVQYMRRLLQQATGKLYLIVDGHPVHRSVVARDFVAANETRLRLIRLPGYCPELNPDELLNQDVKTNGLGKSRPANRAELMAGVRSHLRRRQKQPQVIRNLFQEKHVRYAA